MTGLEVGVLATSLIKVIATASEHLAKLDSAIRAAKEEGRDITPEELAPFTEGADEAVKRWKEAIS